MKKNIGLVGLLVLALVAVGCGEAKVEIVDVLNANGVVVASNLDVAPNGTVSVPIPGALKLRLSGVGSESDPTLMAGTGGTKNLCSDCIPYFPEFFEEGEASKECCSTWVPWAIGGTVGVVGIVVAIVELSPPEDTLYLLTLPALSDEQDSYRVRWPLSGGEVFEFTLIDSSPPPTTETGTVPNLTGLTQDEASTAIWRACLVVGTITTVTSATVPGGHVVSQSLLAGSSVDCGTRIDLVVSSGTGTELTGVSFIIPSADSVTIGVGETLHAEVSVTGIGNVEVVMVSPQGEVYRQSVTLPVTVHHDFWMDVAGNGLLTAQAANDLTGAFKEDSVSVTVRALPDTGEGEGEGESDGPCTVPNLDGLTELEARVALEDTSIVVGHVTETASDTVPAGTVIRSAPPAGATTPCGTGLTLFISTGSTVTYGTVPDVVGMTRVDAVTEIRANCLEVDRVTGTASDTVPVGTVIRSAPIAGTVAPCGTKIDLVVSTGPVVTPLSVTILSPSDGVVLSTGSMVFSTVINGGDGTPIALVAVSPEGDTRKQTLTLPLPARADFSFTLALKGTGMFSIQATQSGLSVTKKVSVTVQ